MNDGARDARRFAGLGLVLCVLAFVDLLLPWQSVEYDVGSGTVEASQNGLNGFGRLTLIALLVAAVCLVLARRAEEQVARPGLGRTLMTASAVVAATTLVHFVDASDFRTGWAWLGLLLSIATAGVGLAVGTSLTRGSSAAVGPALEAGSSPRPAALPTSAPPAPLAPGWYADADRPGRHRWWDGGRWGMTDSEYLGEPKGQGG